MVAFLHVKDDFKELERAVFVSQGLNRSKEVVRLLLPRIVAIGLPVHAFARAKAAHAR